MKIDMFWIWTLAFVTVVLFQMVFTVKKELWEVAYTYTTDSRDYIAYGQTSISRTSGNGNISFAVLRSFIQDELAVELDKKEKILVVVLSTNKIESDRYWRPFWKVTI